MVALLDEGLWFPDPRKARSDGLVAVGGDLSVERLLLAYRCGVFPWSAEPITWWSPSPRAIFDLEHIHISRSLARTLRKKTFGVTCDEDFEGVIRGCADARRRKGQTWISPEFIAAYTRLHYAGHAHSVEVWHERQLAGGIYGVTVGGLFAGESMFHRVTDASKVAFVHCARRLAERRFTLFDTQMVTNVTSALGAFEISRKEYLTRLASAVFRSCEFD
jgi:leucyl/phenylalanyl-tRNA--protein transferase